MTPPENHLGLYLKGRRVRLDPAAFGLCQSPSHAGLRQEEVGPARQYQSDLVHPARTGSLWWHPHPVLGPVAFEHSAFAVDGRPDLTMVVYNPATPGDAQKINRLIA
jgi:hypothetical protein